MSSEYFWPSQASGGGSGTVTSVALTVPAFLSVSGSPITTSGTLALSYSGTALPIANGGTGQTSAANAINALLPTQTGHSGEFLTTNGTVASWAAGGSGANTSLSNLASPTAVSETLTMSATKTVRLPANVAIQGADGIGGWTDLIRSVGTTNLIVGTDTSAFINVTDAYMSITTQLAGVIDGNIDFNTPEIDLFGDGTDATKLRFWAGNQSKYVDLQAPASLAANFALTLPPNDGTAGQVLTTDGSGVMTWEDAGGGSSSGASGAVQFSGGSGAFASDENQLFWDDGANKLGIGTDAPSEKLTVQTATNDYGITHTDGTISLTTYLSTSGVAAGFIGTKTNHGIGLYTNDGNAGIFLDIPSNNSFVGINQIVPTAQLEIKQTSGQDVLRLGGSTSGYVGFNVPAVAGSTSYTWPDSGGAAGTVLTDVAGDGVLSWEAGGGVSFPLLASDGSAANPSYAFSTNPGVGLFYVNSGTEIHMSLGTTDTFKWNSSGFLPLVSEMDIASQGLPFKNIWGKYIQSVAGGQLILRNATNSISFAAPSGLAADFAYTLPLDDGTTGQVFVTDGSGVLSWGGSDTVPVLIDTAANGTAGSTVDTGSLTLQSGSTNSTVTDVKSGGIIIQSGASTGTHSPAGDIQSGAISISSGATVNGFSGSLAIGSGSSEYQSGDVLIQTGGGLVADDAYSGEIFLATGNVTGTAESGDISIGTGSTDSSDLRGDIILGMHSLFVPQTITAGGTTGAQTIDKVSGTVNFAASASSLVVTNNTVTTSSLVFAVVRTADTTAAIKNVVPGAGSFTINLSAAATAETSVGFFVLN